MKFLCFSVSYGSKEKVKWVKKPFIKTKVIQIVKIKFICKKGSDHSNYRF